MPEPVDADVVVAGLGPVGQLTALLLAREDLRVVAVDRAAGPYALPRAAAVDDEVLRILQNAGVTLRERVEDPDVELVTRSGAALPVLAPRARPYGHPPLAFLHQPDLERALLEALAARPRASLRWGAAVASVAQDDRGVTASLADGSVIRARWLVACDGARSPIRAGLGIPFRGRAAPRPWLVVDAAVSRPVTDRPTAQFVGDVRRPAVSLPLGAAQHRWEFLVLPGEDPGRLATRVGELIAPWVDPSTARILRAVPYVYEARVAARWRDGRVLLAGDAAHLMPPFAGQGMSSGLRDAANLAWKLAAVARGDARLALLDSYEQERRPHVQALTRLAVGWGAAIQTRRPAVAAVRDAVVRAHRHVPGLRAAVEGYRIKPAPAFRAGAFSPARHRGRRAGGHLFPQPRVRVDGAVSALDDVLGPGWSVLAWDHDAPGTRRLGRESDVDGVLGSWFRRHGARLVVLRPDRVVFATDAREAARAWAPYGAAAAPFA